MIEKKFQFKKFYPYLVGCILITALPLHGLASSHDISSQALLEYFLISGVKWGVDFIQNAGPFSFVSYPNLYTGNLLGPRVLINLCLSISLVYYLCRPLKAPSNAIYIVLIVLGFFAYGDAKSYFIIIAALLTSRKMFDYCLLAIICAIYSLAKSTLLFPFLLYFTALGVMSLLFRQRRWQLIPGIFYIIFFMIGWKLSGQDICSLPIYFKSLLEFIGGYSASLVVYETWWEFAYSIMLLGINIYFVFTISLKIYKSSGDINNILNGIFAAVVVFIAYKHSFVRADMHMMIFAYLSICIFTLTFWLNDRPVKIFCNTAFKIPLSFLIVVSISSLVVHRYVPLEKHISGRINELKSFAMFYVNPVGYIREFKKTNDKFQVESNVDFYKKKLAGRKFTYYGYSPYMVPLIGGDFCTSYSTVNFAGWNKYVDRMDYDSFVKCNPDAIIFDVSTADDFITTSNSPLVLQKIIDDYVVDSIVDDHMLLTKKSEADLQQSAGLSLHGKKILGNVSLTNFDKIIALFTKMPEVKICGNVDKSKRCYKTTVERLNAGFYITNFYNDNSDVFESRARSMDDFTIECRNRIGVCALNGSLEINELPQLTLSKSAWVDFKTNRLSTVFKIKSDHMPRWVGDALLLHPPTQLMFRKGQWHRIVLTFKFLKTAFPPLGKTDGVVLKFREYSSSGSFVKTRIVKPLNPDLVEKIEFLVGDDIETIVIQVESVGTNLQDHFAVTNIEVLN